jgi:hypothetical protein
VSVSAIIQSITAEFRRYKALGDSALAQLEDGDLAMPGPGGGNSATVLVWHIGGNLASRFTDFLASDGEKPWRQRDEEFARRTVARPDLLEKWNAGWNVLFSALDGLTDDHLRNTVAIRGQEFEVHDALHRALAHISYHVGQLVYLAKSIRGESWTCLSIPIGGSAAANKNPSLQDPAARAAAVAAKATKMGITTKDTTDTKKKDHKEN